MDKQPQVLVKLKGGDHCLCNVKDETEFSALYVKMMEREKFDDKQWIVLGDRPFKALLKKEDIERVFYFPEGYVAPNSGT